jgi:hypothetical protein
MNLPDKNPTTPHPPKPALVEVDLVSLPKMHRLLVQAAELAAGAGVPPDAFAHVAWQSYLQAFPALAERLAEAQFETSLQQLRDSGRLAKA